MLIDITEQKEREEKLRNSSDELGILVHKHTTELETRTSDLDIINGKLLAYNEKIIHEHYRRVNLSLKLVDILEKELFYQLKYRLVKRRKTFQKMGVTSFRTMF